MSRPDRPTNLTQLVEFLTQHPRVRESCGDPRVTAAGDMTFLETREGGLWFRCRHNFNRYLPVDCGMTPAESGFLFDAEGFAVEKFGVTIRYTYLADEGTPP